MWQMASLRSGVKYNTFLSRFKSVIISSYKAYYIPHLMGICSLLNSTGSNINSVNSSQSLPVIIPVCSLCVFLQLCYLSWRGDWPGFSNALFPVCDGRNIWCTRVLPKLVRFKSNLWFGSSVTNFSSLKWSIKTRSRLKTYTFCCQNKKMWADTGRHSLIMFFIDLITEHCVVWTYIFADLANFTIQICVFCFSLGAPWV